MLDGRRHAPGVDDVRAHGGIESGHGELHPVAGADKILVGLRELHVEVEHVRLHGAAGFQPFVRHAEAFLKGLNRFLAHGNEGGRLEHRVVAAADLVDQVVEQSLQHQRRRFGDALGHLRVEARRPKSNTRYFRPRLSARLSVSGGLLKSDSIDTARWFSIIMNAWGGLSVRAYAAEPPSTG